MIFIPENDKCTSWNELDDLIYIKYPYNDKVEIMLEWKKHDNDYDPFYLYVISFKIENNNFNVLRCYEYDCNNFPQLIYEEKSKKYLCTCQKSNIDRTGATYVIDENHGFYNNPIDAILYWNKEQAEKTINISNKYMNTFEQQFTKDKIVSQCFKCNDLDATKMDMNTKKWYVKCCNENFHLAEDLTKTPESCPYYCERIMINLNMENK